MADDLNAWTAAFYKRMQNPGISPTGAITTPNGTTLADLFTQSQVPREPELDFTPPPVESSPNFFQKAMDILMRPSYAVGNMFDAAITNRTPGAAHENIWEEAGKGFTGKDKTDFFDVIDEHTDLEGPAKFAAGLGGALLFDPINFVPGAAVAAPFKAARGAISGSTKVSKALKEAEKTVAAERAAEEASELARKKLAEADITGTPVDPSITNQILHDSEVAATKPDMTSAEGIKAFLADLEKTQPERIRESITNPTVAGSDEFRPPYIDPETIVPGATANRFSTGNLPDAEMMNNLLRVATPDDMKAWRDIYKARFAPHEQRALSTQRDPVKFRTMAQNFIATPRNAADVPLSEILLNAEKYTPETIQKVLKQHGADSMADLAHKYRFTPDAAEQRAATVVSIPIEKQPAVIAQRLREAAERDPAEAARQAKMAEANTALDDTLAVQKAAREKNAAKVAAEPATPAEVKGTYTRTEAVILRDRAQDASNKAKWQRYIDKLDNTTVDDVAVAKKAAEDSARQAQATQTRTSAPKVYGNEAQGKSIARYVRKANEDNRKIELKGAQAATATREHTIQKMEILDAAARAAGDDPFIHVGALSPGSRRFNITTNEVLKTLVSASDEIAGIVDRSLFNASTSIGTEAFQQGAAEALRLYDDFLLRGGTPETWVGSSQYFAEEVADIMTRATTGDYLKMWSKTEGRTAKQQGYWSRMKTEMEMNRVAMANALEQVLPKLHDIQVKNIAARNATNVQDAATITANVTAKVDEAAAKGSVPALNEVADATKSVKEASETVGASPKATYEAAAKIAAQIKEKYGVTQEQVQRLRRAAEARAAHGPKAQPTITRANREQARADIQEADEVGRAVLGPEYTFDLSQQHKAAQTNIFMKILAPFGRRFTYGFQAGELATIIKEGRSAAYSIGKRYEKLLTKIMQNSTKEEQAAALSSLRMGKEPALGTPERVLYDDIKESLDITYDTSAFYNDKSTMLTNWFAQGIPIEEMNKAFAAVKLPHRFEPPKPGAKWDTVPDQWRNWAVDDVVEFAHKSFEAMQRVATMKSAGMVAAAKFGSKSPKPGWVRLADKSGDSPIMPFMDKELFYPKEFAQQVSNLDWMMRQAVSFAGSKNGFGKFVREVVDPTMQIWKPLITIAKPGHHIRNMTGDFFITALDVGFLRLGPAYAKAGRIMHGNKAWEGAASITQLAGLTERIGANSGKERVGVVLRGGKKEMLDDANIYKLGFQRGLFPEFTRSEDLIKNEGTGLLSKAANKMQTSKPMQVVGDFAELTSHTGRMAHFIALMEKRSFTRKYSTLEDASRAAAERIKKHHPDTSGLAPFEQKYMRRLFPFYTWFRQTTPVVMGAIFTRPGAVIAPNKIQAAFANQFGVNPNSLADPFPDGHTYPSWIRDSMTGPITPDGLMMNTGSPQEGILPDLLSSNPARSIANMVTPFIKQPVEALTQTKVQTGTPITDQSEFWDQIVPGATTVNQLTSQSVLGSIGGLVEGTGLDPLRSVQQGDQSAFFNRSLANFWTGLGFTNVETPTVKRSNFKEMTGYGPGSR